MLLGNWRTDFWYRGAGVLLGTNIQTLGTRVRAWCLATDRETDCCYRGECVLLGNRQADCSYRG